MPRKKNDSDDSDSGSDDSDDSGSNSDSDASKSSKSSKSGSDGSGSDKGSDDGSDDEKGSDASGSASGSGSGSGSESGSDDDASESRSTARSASAPPSAAPGNGAMVGVFERPRSSAAASTKEKDDLHLPPISDAQRRLYIDPFVKRPKKKKDPDPFKPRNVKRPMGRKAMIATARAFDVAVQHRQAYQAALKDKYEGEGSPWNEAPRTIRKSRRKIKKMTVRLYADAEDKENRKEELREKWEVEIGGFPGSQPSKKLSKKEQKDICRRLVDDSIAAERVHLQQLKEELIPTKKPGKKMTPEQMDATYRRQVLGDDDTWAFENPADQTRAASTSPRNHVTLPSFT
eukprot:NODE_2235_length_1169_cov_21.785714_g1853_i0.p1 GENE.NODE_2235_length_1169_cov_21.785714_g1853_i0~~NODE_2235_length_1169_cov_21.785714_g1853_i0.p1  ORF type:complete len:345 (-),score=81.20 NODE_2235_length_1169_cov_21.785714_g1853_i0:42-1076(-)